MATALDSIRGTVSDLALSNPNWSNTDRSIVEMFKQTNEILDEMIMVQCNNKTVHKSTVRTALPDVAWRMLNRGIKPTKGGKKQETFTTGVLESHSEVDERELIYGEPGSEANSQYRLDESKAHQMAMSNKMATTLFYGDEKINPAGFTGLGAYYYSLDPEKCIAADYVVDAGGTGNNLTSLYFVVWDPATIHGIFPEGTVAGFKHRDNGRVQIPDAVNGGSFWGYQTQLNWDLGLAVRDFRYGVRVANIDVTNLDAKFLNTMIGAHEKIEDMSAGKVAIYCNRSVRTYLSKLAADKHNVMLNIDMYHGKRVTHFWDAPIRRVDAILNTEERIV